MNREEASRILHPDTRDVEFEKDVTHWGERLDKAMKMGAEALLDHQPDLITGSVPCGCKYCDPTHGQRYLFRENKNAPYRGMISTVEITQDDCKKYSQIEGNLYDENGNNFYFVFDIRHCPMCGMNLRVTP